MRTGVEVARPSPDARWSAKLSLGPPSEIPRLAPPENLPPSQILHGLGIGGAPHEHGGWAFQKISPGVVEAWDLGRAVPRGDAWRILESHARRMMPAETHDGRIRLAESLHGTPRSTA